MIDRYELTRSIIHDCPTKKGTAMTPDQTRAALKEHTHG